MSGGITRLDLDGPLEVVYGPLMVADDVLPEMITPEQIGFMGSRINGGGRSQPGSLLRRDLSPDFVCNGPRHFALQLQHICECTLVIADPQMGIGGPMNQ